jgi:hypothetical protein
VFQDCAGVVENSRCSREHFRIAVQTDEFSVGSKLFQDQFAMTAAPHCSVDHHQSRARFQELQNFPDEDRTMDGRAGVVAGRRRIGHWVARNVGFWGTL